jgi:hypothetical protein
MQHWGELHRYKIRFSGSKAIIWAIPQRGIWQLPRLLPPHRFQRRSAIALLLAAGLLIFSYWPGIMTWDPIEQYDQAVQNAYADWHPPIMAWIWHFLIPIYPGTGPMFVLQSSFYLGGYGLLTSWALKRGQPASALAFAICALMPIPMALMGSVLKDCLMTGALLSAVALMLWQTESRNRLLPIASIALLLLATALRFNAFPAAAPLIVASLPASWRRGRTRLVAASLVILLSLLTVQPLVNRLLGAERTGVELSQVIFDLAGITEHSGVNAFPETISASDPVAATHLCYSPEMWDNFASWDDPPKCAINFDDVRITFAETGQNPGVFLLRAIAAHPLAYAEHRWEHLKINLRLNVAKVNYRPAPDQSITNPWNYDFRPNRVQYWVNRAALITDRSPLGWPICWLALALGILMISPALPSRRLIVPISLSVILYGLSYAMISVASDLRYHLWTMVGTCVAAVLVAGDLANGATPQPVKRICAAATPFFLATAFCLIARISVTS